MRICAFLADPSAENRVHNPEDARRFGFAGGLVPGVDVYAYLTRPVVERRGLEWLRQGGGELRLLRPVYGGDDLEVEFDGETATATRADGEVCATLTVARDAEPVPAADFPERPLPTRRWEPSEASFKEHGFGTYKETVTEEQARRHLRDVLETLSIYDAEAILHPGHLLRFANIALSANYRLGPWLHVGSRIQHLGLVRRGQEVQARARLAACFEKKAHRFIELDVFITGVHVVHTAIYEPAFIRNL
jgi:hypothetical protein